MVHKDKPYRCTVRDWLEMLSQYNPDLPVRVHTSTKHNLFLLSGYTDEKKKFFEIDVGTANE